MHFDVVGIGNALMDVLVRIESDEILSSLELTKGIMHPVNHEKWTEIFDHFQTRELVYDSGGSCANSVATVGRLGGNTTYCGQIGGDDFGEIYASKMKESCGQVDLQKSVDIATGKCLSIISQSDAERTMVTDLGAAVRLENIESFYPKIADAKIVHFTGYTLLDGPMVESIIRAMQFAKNNGTKVSLDAADPFVVDTISERLWDVLEKYVDIAFFNADEARMLSGIEPENAAEFISKKAGIETVVVKLGSKGSTVFRSGTLSEIPVYKVEAIDTTGAGDAYAGGFLYGVSQGLDTETSGRMASAIAAFTVSQVGAVVKDPAAIEKAKAFSRK